MNRSEEREARIGAVSLGRLVQQHQGAVRGFLRRLCADRPDLADDLAQETFLKAWEKIETVDPDRNPKAWLCGIAYRLYLGHRRSWVRRLLRDTAFFNLRPESEDRRGESQARLDVTRAMKQLNEEQAAVVCLCLGGEFTHTEAAEALGIPLGTVKSHIQRGRQVLMLALGAEA